MGLLSDILKEIGDINRKTVRDELVALSKEELCQVARETKIVLKGTRQEVIDKILDAMEKQNKNEVKDKNEEIKKKLEKMTAEELKVMAKKRKLTYYGTQGELVQILLDDIGGSSKTKERIDLEEAMMDWTGSELKAFLMKKEKPYWGTKKVMMQRIIGCISIEEAVEIVKEYRAIIEQREENFDEDGVIIERSEGNKKVDEVELSAKEVKAGEDGMELDPDGWNDKQEEINKRKRMEEDGTREEEVSNDDEPEKNVGEILHAPQANDGARPPPKHVHGKTSDKDTMIQASERGGNDRLSNVDEAGWQMYKGGKDANAGNKNDEDNNSVATLRVDNIHRTRIGIHVTAPPSTQEPDKKLCLQFQKWFTKMKEIDNKFAIVPWKLEDKQQALIRTPDKIPKMMSKMKIYFSRAQAKSGGGRSYTDVYIQHSVPISDLKGDAEWFLSENAMGIYNKKLQVEATTQMGWLLYSTIAMDQPTLEKEIMDTIGVEVALRWKYIATEKWAADADERKKWMALHIEVPKEQSRQAARGLAKIYGSTSEKFPLGIRMRLVSEFREVKGNPTMMAKHMRLRLRQAKFMSMVVGHPTDDIMLLDYQVNEISLRDLIMGIQSRDKATPGNLFHAVGKDWKGRIIINYLKIKSDEAAMIADGLIPYLQKVHGEEINQFFDPEAVVEKELWEWDEKKGVIINPLSRELDGLDDMDDDYDFSEIISIEKNNSTSEQVQKTAPNTVEDLAQTRLNMLLTGNDVDSVSTLGNPLTPTHKNASYSPSFNAPVKNTTISEQSVSSQTTLDTRITEIEQQISGMKNDLQKTMKESLESVLGQFLQKQQASPSLQLPGGASAGETND